MGPTTGPSQDLVSRHGTRPVFAAMANGAAAQLAEQVDVHNGAVFYPGAVVFPPALATAQDLKMQGRTRSPRPSCVPTIEMPTAVSPPRPPSSAASSGTFPRTHGPPYSFR